MLYSTPTVNINSKKYDVIIPIGNRCITAMVLKMLNLSQESFPFDYIPSNPKLILKYFNNPKDFYPIKNNVRNIDNICFGHFNVTDKYEETISTFERRFQRLFSALENKKKILFVYTSECDIYNGYANKDNDTTNYDDLLKIKDFIINKYDYNYDNFTIMAIHTNKSYKNTDNMINYSIIVESKYISNNMSTHNQETWTKYRDTVKSLMKEIFKL